MGSQVLKRELETEKTFLQRLRYESRRVERSQLSALLVLISFVHKDGAMLIKFGEELSKAVRETDVMGWYERDASLGVIFVELDKDKLMNERAAIVCKLSLLARKIMGKAASEIVFATHTLPLSSDDETRSESDREFLTKILRGTPQRSRAECSVQRCFDLAGSITLLLLLAPVFVLIGTVIKITSRGPVLFRQVRSGFEGRKFTVLKFRTMHVDNDTSVHQDFVKDFINGTAKHQIDQNGQPVFKLTNDARVTWIGKLLRRTSLDELPQLWNVLRGEMSLVGPRPPIPYEVALYEAWHHRRLFDLKPGLTGVWQVRGRSRCSFDEMVRMDLMLAKRHSLGLYLTVLWETPRAVFHGNGAH